MWILVLVAYIWLLSSFPGDAEWTWLLTQIEKKIFTQKKNQLYRKSQSKSQSSKDFVVFYIFLFEKYWGRMVKTLKIDQPSLHINSFVY